MKIQKKHIIPLVVGLAIVGTVVYYQYKKIIDYIIGFRNVKINKITATDVSFDLFLNFTKLDMILSHRNTISTLIMFLLRH